MLSGKFYDWENFFFGGGGVKFWSKDLSGFCLKPLGFDFCPHSIIPVDHSCHLNWGLGQFVLGRVGGVSVEIPVGWWKRDSPAFRSPEVGISDSALANHPTQFLPLLESIGFPPFKAGRLGFTLLQLQRDITLTISQLIPQFTPFLSRPSCSRHFIGLPALPSFARFCSARISSYTCEIFSGLEKASFDMANYKSPQFDLGILRRQN